MGVDPPHRPGSLCHTGQQMGAPPRTERLTAAVIAGLAASPDMRDCLQWVQREKQWINERHLAVCRVSAPTFFEQKRAERKVEQFRSLGFEAQLDRAGNVIAFSNAAYSGPLIALTAH